MDIWLACRDILEFTAGVAEEHYRRNRKLQNAPRISLEMIGEAARNLTQTFKDRHSEIPWAEMVGLRHRIVHEYFRLDLDVIWHIVREDVPSLADAIKRLVPPEVEPP